VSQNRANVVQANPNADFKEVSQLVSQKWKELPQEEKQKYVDLHALDKIRYKEEVANKPADQESEEDSSSSDSPKKKKRKKREKAEGEPKQSLTSFMLYSQAMRATVKQQDPSITTAQIGKLLGLKWKELPSEEKQLYIDKAAELKAKYNEELRQWKEQHEAKHSPNGKKDNKRDRDSEQDDEPKPKKVKTEQQDKDKDKDKQKDKQKDKDREKDKQNKDKKDKDKEKDSDKEKDQKSISQFFTKKEPGVDDMQQ